MKKITDKQFHVEIFEEMFGLKLKWYQKIFVKIIGTWYKITQPIRCRREQ